MEEIVWNITLKNMAVLAEQRCMSGEGMNKVIDCLNWIMSEVDM